MKKKKPQYGKWIRWEDKLPPKRVEILGLFDVDSTPEFCRRIDDELVDDSNGWTYRIQYWLPIPPKPKV